jgi:hypothetical protein
MGSVVNASTESKKASKAFASINRVITLIGDIEKPKSEPKIEIPGHSLLQLKPSLDRTKEEILLARAFPSNSYASLNSDIIP